MTDNLVFRRSVEDREVPNFERNKLLQSDRAFHDWYRFVLSYPPHLVRTYIEKFQLKKTDLVLDPFCGTGTTVVECRLNGIPSVGLEANRFAAFAGQTKTDWDIDPRQLNDVAEEIGRRAISRLRKQKESDELLELAPEQQKIILKNSISPLPLHKALILLKEIDRSPHTKTHRHLKIALAKTLVYKISNLRFGPEVGIGKLKLDADVINLWRDEIRVMCSDLDLVSGMKAPPANVHLSDSRNTKAIISGPKVTAVITSPPYPNEKDYTRTTRLESVILGFVSNKDELREMKKTLLRSNTRGVYKGDDDDRYVDNIPEIQKIADQIESTRIALGKTSGFERMYARLTKLYFGGMAKHLLELQSVLKPGAQLAYVVGDQASYLRVMIRTGEILARVAESIGYEVVGIDLFRTRFSTATKSNLNEEVVILRWPGKKIKLNHGRKK